MNSYFIWIENMNLNGLERSKGFTFKLFFIIIWKGTQKVRNTSWKTMSWKQLFEPLTIQKLTKSQVNFNCLGSHLLLHSDYIPTIKTQVSVIWKLPLFPFFLEHWSQIYLHIGMPWAVSKMTYAQVPSRHWDLSSSEALPVFKSPLR